LTKQKEKEVAPLSDTGKKALLHLCYMTVRQVAPKHGSFDALTQAHVAEGLADKIEMFIKAQPNNSVMEFEVQDADTFDYLCDILDTLQKTLPFMNRFNVVLHIERLVREEPKDAAAVINRDREGDSEDLDF
jgi:hypothetical protein